MAAIEAGRAKRAAVMPVNLPPVRPDDDAGPGRPGVRRELLSVTDAAECLGICARNVARLTAPHGPLPCVRMGRRVCYARGDLEAFIKAQTVRA